ncbi:MAG: orotidine 5-phosphate decarboxylase [Bacteroidetes bacterium]|jgi:orotidine-5'-phosphate decarboxylase|nr:orotidine 5-phosphate decarboxylase [Bacteroidota bacterium]
MKRAALIEEIQKKRSFLCVGLDPDMNKLPKHLLNMEDPILEFNKAIIDATHEYCVAYKPNMAFYEAHGLKGWQSLDKTITYLRQQYPDHFTIADAKRGDIGNTSAMYAKAFLEGMQFDSITVAPYMGSDSVKPFLSIPDKWVILLALTSNEGAFDFQFLKSGEKQLFETVLETSKAWGNDENMMYVVGATKAESLAEIRKIIPSHFLLVPGVGAQGGSLQDVCKHGFTKDCGLLINASRSILYASGGTDFAEKAKEEARKMQREMQTELLNSKLIHLLN